jgi:VanZ family protein
VKYLRLLPLAIALLLLAVASVLSASTMAALRLRLPWFSEAINRIEALFDGVDSTHVLMFAGIGLLLAWSLPRLRPWAMLAAGLGVLAVLAALSEVVQFWVPGRVPRLSDFGADMLGGGVGLGVGLVLRALAAGGLGLWRALRPRDTTP